MIAGRKPSAKTAADRKQFLLSLRQAVVEPNQVPVEPATEPHGDGRGAFLQAGPKGARLP